MTSLRILAFLASQCLGGLSLADPECAWIIRRRRAGTYRQCNRCQLAPRLLAESGPRDSDLGHGDRVATQLLLVGYEARRRRIKLAWRVPVNLRPTFLAGAAIIPGVLFAHLSILVPQIVAARLGDGAIASFSIAMRLHGATTQVLAVVLSSVVLPGFAHAAGRGEFSKIAAQLKRSFPVVALISISMLLWVGLVGESRSSLAFERGAFDRSATSSVSSVWFWLTLGLLPTIWGVLGRPCKRFDWVDHKSYCADGARSYILRMCAPFRGRWIAWTCACDRGRIAVYGDRRLHCGCQAPRSSRTADDKNSVQILDRGGCRSPSEFRAPYRGSCVALRTRATSHRP